MSRPPSRSPEPPARRPAGSIVQRFWPLGLFALGALSALIPWFGLPAGFASFIGAVALRRPANDELRGARVWLWAGVALSSIGLVRFVTGEAMRFEAPWPEDLEQLRTALKNAAGDRGKGKRS